MKTKKNKTIRRPWITRPKNTLAKLLQLNASDQFVCNALGRLCNELEYASMEPGILVERITVN